MKKTASNSNGKHSVRHGLVDKSGPRTTSGHCNDLSAPVSVLAIFLWGCLTASIAKYSHKPGEPYYFWSAITYQGYRPSGELTKAEADELAEQGGAYYIASFNFLEKPNRILKIYKGKTVLDQEIKYDANGDEVGVGPNRAEDVE